MEVLTVSTKTRRGILLEIVFTTLMILNVNHADEGGGGFCCKYWEMNVILEVLLVLAILLEVLTVISFWCRLCK